MGRVSDDARRYMLAASRQGMPEWQLGGGLLVEFALPGALGLAWDPATGSVRVEPGGPADRAGVRGGMRLVSVNGDALDEAGLQALVSTLTALARHEPAVVLGLTKPPPLHTRHMARFGR